MRISVNSNFRKFVSISIYTSPSTRHNTIKKELVLNFVSSHVDGLLLAGLGGGWGSTGKKHTHTPAGYFRLC